LAFPTNDTSHSDHHLHSLHHTASGIYTSTFAEPFVGIDTIQSVDSTHTSTRYPLQAVSWRFFVYARLGLGFGYFRAMVSFGTATTRYDSFLVLVKACDIGTTDHGSGM
jgi:hypothetical protein